MSAEIRSSSRSTPRGEAPRFSCVPTSAVPCQVRI
uniref:Uncharacterized protein n=1 Tax=Anguilla anguilla TaxID=7936 RepID=A0A0E9UZH8_ANGAN